MEGYYQRTLTVEECRQYLGSALSTLTRLNPPMKLVVTLSPVPLARTFEFGSALVADAVSKSTLRAALHELSSMYPGKIFYFPSYEVVTWLGRYRGDAFASNGTDTRHVSDHFVEAILNAFIRNYQIEE